MEPRIDTHVAGAFREERNVNWASVIFPEWVQLQRQFSNEHDENAIAVLLKGEMVGYVPRTVAADLAPQIDQGWAHGAFLKN